eukprot:g20647.t1
MVPSVPLASNYLLQFPVGSLYTGGTLGSCRPGAGREDEDDHELERLQKMLHAPDDDDDSGRDVEEDETGSSDDGCGEKTSVLLGGKAGALSSNKRKSGRRGEHVGGQKAKKWRAPSRPPMM